MDWGLIKLNRRLKRFDKELFAQKSSTGRVDIYRKIDSLHRSMTQFEYQPPMTQFIVSLTDTWHATGIPVERGIDNIINHLNWMDCWRDDGAIKRMQENRERNQRIKDKSFKNDIRARAYDMRSEFAKATNDINTSLIKGALKNGNC